MSDDRVTVFVPCDECGREIKAFVPAEEAKDPPPRACGRCLARIFRDTRIVKPEAVH